MDEKKLEEMAEGVVAIRKGQEDGERRMDRIETLLDKSSGTLVKVDKSMGVLEDWRSGVDEWRKTMDTSIDEMRQDVQDCKRSNIFTGLDQKTLLKVVLVLFSMLVASNAGGEALNRLIELIMSIGG